MSNQYSLIQYKASSSSLLAAYVEPEAQEGLEQGAFAIALATHCHNLRDWQRLTEGNCRPLQLAALQPWIESASLRSHACILDAMLCMLCHRLTCKPHIAADSLLDHT